MNKVCAALLSSLVLWLYSTALTQPSQAQQRKRTARPNYVLPKAGFQSMTGIQPGSSELPVVDGVHLQDGLSRRPDSASAFQPYDAGEPSLNGALVRWDQSRFPLRIWISDGKKLPDLPFELVQQERVNQVAAMLRNPKSFDELPECPSWTPQMNDMVAEGFELWRPMESEGVVKYGYVDNPRNADIVVFFTDNFIGAAGPGGTDVHGITMGHVFTPQQYSMKLNRGEPCVPVVMELKINENLSKLQADAAHEFGHALGIKAHSPYREDLMYVNRVATQPSPADKATLRALYKTKPKYWYY